ncbi:hypothetical protein ACLKA7_013203 [Drosophila subpalustris]
MQDFITRLPEAVSQSLAQTSILTIVSTLQRPLMPLSKGSDAPLLHHQLQQCSLKCLWHEMEQFQQLWPCTRPRTRPRPVKMQWMRLPNAKWLTINTHLSRQYVPHDKCIRCGIGIGNGNGK